MYPVRAETVRAQRDGTADVGRLQNGRRTRGEIEEPDVTHETVHDRRPSSEPYPKPRDDETAADVMLRGDRTGDVLRRIDFLPVHHHGLGKGHRDVDVGEGEAEDKGDEAQRKYAGAEPGQSPMARKQSPARHVAILKIRVIKGKYFSRG